MMSFSDFEKKMTDASSRIEASNKNNNSKKRSRRRKKASKRNNDGQETNKQGGSGTEEKISMEKTEFGSVVVLWFRNDLRIHDNMLLHHPEITTDANNRRVVAVYCIDPRYFGLRYQEDSGCCGEEDDDCFDKKYRDFEERDWFQWMTDNGGGTPGSNNQKQPKTNKKKLRSRCGVHRSYFLAETLVELHDSLRSTFGIPLLVVRGTPERVIPKLFEYLTEEINDNASASTTKADGEPTLGGGGEKPPVSQSANGDDGGGVVVNRYLFFQGEDTTEETEIEQRLCSRLTTKNDANIRVHYGQTLYHRDDIRDKMGFDIAKEHLPFPFGKFFHETCKTVRVRHEIQPVLPSKEAPVRCKQRLPEEEDKTTARFNLAEDDVVDMSASIPFRVRVASIVRAMGFSGDRQRDVLGLLLMQPNPAENKNRNEIATHTTATGVKIHGANIAGYGQNKEQGTAFIWRGGESHALDRLQGYVNGGLWNYHQTRNQLHGTNMSSLLSPWLANGSISVRRVYWAVRRAEDIKKRRQKQNQSKNQRFDHVHKFWFELCWRDYFRFYCAHFRERVFFLGGPAPSDKPQNWHQIPWHNPWGRPQKQNNEPAKPKAEAELLRAWVGGRTNQPLIDALMRELLATGYVSNRGRYIVASFLTHYLGIDWRLGASWFECMLLDHDVCSNYGEWSSMAGVARHPKIRTPLGIKGRGPKTKTVPPKNNKRAAPSTALSAASNTTTSVVAVADKAGSPWARGAAENGFSVFDPEDQARQYDKDGEYVSKWQRQQEQNDNNACRSAVAAGRDRSRQCETKTQGDQKKLEPFRFKQNTTIVLGSVR